MSAALPVPAGGVSARRRWAGAAVGVLGLPAVTLPLVPGREAETFTTPVLLVLTVVVATAVVGGLWPALPAAVAGALLLNLLFTEPYNTLFVSRGDRVLALAVYVVVAVAVSVVVDVSAVRRAQAARARAEAEELSRLAGASTPSPEELLERLREVFGLHRAAVLDADGAVLATVGTARPDDVALRVEVEDAVVVTSGPPLFAADQRVLQTFAEAAVVALRRRREAAAAAELAQVDRLRTTLLAGVGHDLRTPLAGIKATVSSLRATDVTFSEQERAELLGSLEEATDRLSGVVADLLDASRLQQGVLSVELVPVGLDEVVARALVGVRGQVGVAVDEDLPFVRADPGLLERVVANLVDNAVRHGGGASVIGGPGWLDVVDHGPGVADPGTLFVPFAGDHAPGGLGLGLWVARGFTEAMGGRLTPRATPGGGLTMRVDLGTA